MYGSARAACPCDCQRNSGAALVHKREAMQVMAWAWVKPRHALAQAHLGHSSAHGPTCMPPLRLQEHIVALGLHYCALRRV